MYENMLKPSVEILMESATPSSYGMEYEKIKMVLEDATSPITAKYKEKLYKSVMDRSHIDFGDIPQSKGNIKSYHGYQSMMDTLGVIIDLGTVEKSNVVKYANIVMEAIHNIESLADVYQKGFASKTPYVMLEYNTYVYTCVQATTALLYNFVDYVKRPDKPTYVITLSNNKNRADLFYFDQLSNFNNVNKNMQINYRKMMESVINRGKNNFTGVEFVGLATISIVALAIIPITRELVYHFYSLRSNITNELEMQARFLEMNKTCVEANSAFTEDKKRDILNRQEKIRKTLLNLADKIRIKEVKAGKESKKEITKSNDLLSMSDMRDEVSNSPLEFI